MQVQPNQTVNQQFCFQVLAKSQEVIQKSIPNWWSSCLGSALKHTGVQIDFGMPVFFLN
jgi:hypothetical protein